MKGIILAGGEGNRLKPLTKVSNKHLLPVYNKPMIFYPLDTLRKAGIHDILIISSAKYAGMFLELLGDGSRFGCHFHFRVQEKAEGIAHALSLSRNFMGNEKVAVILGDNIFEDNLEKDVESFRKKKDAGAHIFLKEIDDAKRFGVAHLEGDKVTKIVEKPKNPKSNYAVTGFYLYDKNVFDVMSSLKPSKRGEYEITDVNNAYIKKGALTASVLKNQWSDAGTFESLYQANRIARNIHKKNS